MTKKHRILFVCSGNSARSQIAEGFCREYGGDAVEVQSAGTKPQGLNPNAVAVMQERAIDISAQTSDPLCEQDLAGYEYVITLCGDARDRCPALPGGVKEEHWDLTDPAGAGGEPAKILEAFRRTRAQVELRVRELLIRLTEPA